MGNSMAVMNTRNLKTKQIFADNIHFMSATVAEQCLANMNNLQAVLYLKYLTRKNEEPKQVLCWAGDGDTYMGECIEKKLEYESYGVYNRPYNQEFTSHLLPSPTRYMLRSGFCCHGCGRLLKSHE